MNIWMKTEIGFYFYHKSHLFSTSNPLASSLQFDNLISDFVLAEQEIIKKMCK